MYDVISKFSFICACLVIFFISCNLIGCSNGQLFTISWPWSKRVTFYLQTEEWKQISNSKTALSIDTKDSKIQSIDFNWFSTKPEMYFSPTKIRKTNTNIEKNTDQCYMFRFKCSKYIQLFFEKYTFKYEYYNI
jgi:hypothetical protein